MGGARRHGGTSRRIGTVVASAAVAVAAAAAVVAVFRAFDTVHGIDLRVYYEAGCDVLDGGALYDGARGAARVPLTYPPFAAVAATVLAAVPWNALQWGWAVVNVLALYAVIRLGYRSWLRGGRRPALRAAGLTAVWTASVPVADHLGYGQVGLLLMAACAADADPGVRLPRWVPRGALTGIAAAVRLIPAAYLVLPLARRRLRAVAWGLGAFAACGALAYAVMPSGTRVFVTQVLPDLSARVAVGDPGVHGDQSVRAAVLRALPADAPGAMVDAVWWALGAMVLIAAAAAAVRTSRIRGELAALVVLALGVELAAPVAWTHHFVWLVPAVGLLLTAVPGRGIPASSRAAAVVVVIAAFARAGAVVWRFSPGIPVLDQLGTDSVAIAAAAVIVGLAAPFDVRMRPATRAGRHPEENFLCAPTTRAEP